MAIWQIPYLMGIFQTLFFLIRFTRTRFDILSPSFISGMALLVWFYPKVPDTLESSYIDSNLLASFLTFFLLCQTAMFAGMNLRMKTSRQKKNIAQNYQTWTIFALFLFLIGSLAFYEYSQLPPEVLYMSQPTGFITILIFLSSFLSISMSISLFTYIKSRQSILLLPIIIGVLLYLERILIHGKRSDFFELLFMLGVALLIHQRKRIRLITILTAGFMIVAFNAVVGDYRGIMKSDIKDINAISSIPLLDRVSEAAFKADHDIINAILTFQAFQNDNHSFNWGGDYWNVIVKRYVPGQIIGVDLKNSLYVGSNSFHVMKTELGYDAPTGTTTFFPGGLYSNFGWAGFIVMLFYGCFLRYLYLNALFLKTEYLVLFTFFGAQIPVVIIFGIPSFIAQVVFWFPVLVAIGNISRSKYFNRKGIPHAAA